MLPCPQCGHLICDCLLNDRHFLATRVGTLMRGAGSGHATHQEGTGDKTPTPPVLAEWIFQDRSHGAEGADCARPLQG